MDTFIQQILQLTGSYVPQLVGAVAILILGCFIALVIALVVRNLLHRTTIDNRIAKWITGEEKAQTMNVEKGISKGVFYLLMLFVLIAFFQTLGITLITEPLNNLLNRLFVFVPQLLGAAVLIIIAWIVARVMKLFVTRLLSATKLDERLSSKADIEKEKFPLTKTLSDAVYWLVFLLFFPAILNTLGLNGLLSPVQAMLNKVLVFLPNLITAAVILFVGWFVARIIQKIVASLLDSIGTEKLSERVGLASMLGNQTLSNIVGLIVYVLILIPVLVAALNALQLDALTQPASKMLEMITTAIPDIFVASLILVLSYIIGRIVSNLVSNLLSGIGFNAILAKLGIGKEVTEGKMTPSAIVGYLVLLGILLFAFMEASNQLGFEQLSTLISEFIFLSGHIILGLVIFTIGLFLANLVGKAILTSDTAQAKLLALSARIAILVLAGAMSLRQMGLANEIINLAFGLLFGAIAIAAAIALGLGGREIAAREIEEWVNSIKAKKSQ
ncbi:MAG TPA: mechanosensitive ion channel [Thermodesulfovibrionales bacterium]|nr:mechanosensitive ion channel [Thermodesulfovibrionales bacterium]